MDLQEKYETIQWLLKEAAGAETDEAALFSGLCQRLTEAGLPLLRANTGTATLHPIVAGMDFEWWRGEDMAVTSQWLRQDLYGNPDEMDKYPYVYMLNRELTELRYDLAGGEDLSHLPVLNGLRERGGTDYFALICRYSGSAKPSPIGGLPSAWVTDRPGGWTDAEIATIREVATAMTAAIKGQLYERIGRDLLTTYLGSDAGRRVLEGSIDRGTVESIRAVIWYSDLAGFTRLAETLPKEELIGLLNDYFEIMVDVVHAHQGHVLKFLGDGLLAIFRLDEMSDVCGIALDAAEEAINRLITLSDARASTGKPVVGVTMALHLGDLQYGNFGGLDRLDFTAIGPAVNETARIEQLCRTLDQTILVSSAFHKAAEMCRGRLVSLGRYALRGVSRPDELFTLESTLGVRQVGTAVIAEAG